MPDASVAWTAYFAAGVVLGTINVALKLPVPSVVTVVGFVV